MTDAVEEGTATLEKALNTLIEMGARIDLFSDGRVRTGLTGRDVVGEPNEEPHEVLLRWYRELHDGA